VWIKAQRGRCDRIHSESRCPPEPALAPPGCLDHTGAQAHPLVQWLRDNLGIIRKSSEVEDLASVVQDSGGIYIVPTSSNLYTPYWRCDDGGMVAGLTGQTNKHHIARAVLESTAYQTRMVLDAM
jgi:glycerol kinase